MLQDIAFLHGGGQGGWIWDDAIAALRLQDGGSTRRILVLDVPGCGVKRERDTSGLCHADVIKELADDIDRADLNNALLVGHSQAGTVLPALSAAHPDRIARCVYVTCCAPAFGQTVVAMMGTALHGADSTQVGWPLDPATTTPDTLFKAMFCNDMDDTAAAAFMSKLGHDRWPQACGTQETEWNYASAHDVPATYVIAQRDAILPPAWQRRFAERIGVDRIEHIDSGHQPMNTRPHALAEILRAL